MFIQYSKRLFILPNFLTPPLILFIPNKVALFCQFYYIIYSYFAHAKKEFNKDDKEVRNNWINPP